MHDNVKKYSYIIIFIILLSPSKLLSAENNETLNYDQGRKNRIINDALDSFERNLPNQNRYPALKKINSETQIKSSSSSSFGDDSFSDYANSSSSNLISHQLNTSQEKDQSQNTHSNQNMATPNSDEHLNLLQTGVIYDNTVDKIPRFYFETVLPLEQSPDKEHTFFTHDRISSKGDGNTTFSGGLGYRRLLFDNNLMLGGNTFFDYLIQDKHYRAGLGLEFKTKTIEGNANFYKALSPERQIADSRLLNITEETVDGFDTEIGGPLPYLPWFKIFGGYTRYYYSDAEDPKSWKQRAEVSISKFITLNAEKFNDTIGGIDYRWDARFTLAFESFEPSDLLYAFKSSEQMYPDIDLTTKTLDRVERNFNVVVQRKTNLSEPIVGNLSNVQLVIRFPGLVCIHCSDNNEDLIADPTDGNGIVDQDEGFEADILFTNLSSQTASGISYTNITTSAGLFSSNFDGVLPDAPPGGTSITLNATSDLDLWMNGVPNGTQFTITLDFTVDGQTETLTFGPLTVGAITNGQVVNIL